MTAAFVGLMVWLAWPHLTRVARAFAVSAGLLVALAVGASRIYLGYHWATDVLAAWLVVAAWLGLLFLVVSPRMRPRTAAPVAVRGSEADGATDCDGLAPTAAGPSKALGESAPSAALPGRGQIA
jgi:undecaprenyl-diphosphatase